MYSEACLNQFFLEPTLVFAIDRFFVYTALQVKLTKISYNRTLQYSVLFSVQFKTVLKMMSLESFSCEGLF